MNLLRQAAGSTQPISNANNGQLLQLADTSL